MKNSLLTFLITFSVNLYKMSLDALAADMKKGEEVPESTDFTFSIGFLEILILLLVIFIVLSEDFITYGVPDKWKVEGTSVNNTGAAYLAGLICLSLGSAGYMRSRKGK